MNGDQWFLLAAGLGSSALCMLGLLVGYLIARDGRPRR